MVSSGSNQGRLTSSLSRYVDNVINALKVSQCQLIILIAIVQLKGDVVVIQGDGMTSPTVVIRHYFHTFFLSILTQLFYVLYPLFLFLCLSFLCFITLTISDKEKWYNWWRLLLIPKGQSTGTPQSQNSPSPCLAQGPTPHSLKFSRRSPGCTP